jgi:hypothetical protein
VNGNSSGMATNLNSKIVMYMVNKIHIHPASALRQQHLLIQFTPFNGQGTSQQIYRREKLADTE